MPAAPAEPSVTVPADPPDPAAPADPSGLADPSDPSDPSDAEVIAAHVAALGLAGEAEARFLADAGQTERAVAVRRLLADRLLACAAAGDALSAPLRHAYAVSSDAHDRVLRAAIAAGSFTHRDAVLGAYRTDVLTVALATTPASLPLTFATTLGTAAFHAPDPAGDVVVIDGAFPVTTAHGEFTLGVTSDIELLRAATLTTKEPDTVSWLDAAGGAGTVLLDIGASTGIYSCYAAHLHPGARAIAVEPNPFTVPRLLANVARNGWARRIAVAATALTSPQAAGPLAMHLRATAPGAASPDQLTAAATTLDRTDTHDHNDHTVVTIVATTLDALAASVAASRGPDWAPTHAKIDVDGGELALLAGATATLAHPRLTAVLIEVAERDLDAVAALLRASGFVEEGRRFAGPPVADRGRVGNVRYRRSPP